MSIQWTLVAGILYFEIALVALLLLPFLRPRTWQKFFKSRFLISIENQANLYFMVFIVILVLLFLGKFLLIHEGKPILVALKPSNPKRLPTN